MAIVVLVLWMFTAGAGFYLLVTSNLGRARPAVPEPGAVEASAAAAQPASVTQATSVTQASSATQASRRETRHAIRDRWDPPSLTAAKSAPIVPGARSLLEFAHPACAIIGLAFWLGFTLVHNRTLGWIAFGLIAVTACLGLTWVLANVRAARRGAGDTSAPRFVGRLMILHGSAAGVTVALAALSALVARG
jgi:hypothetical protein